MNFSSIMRDSTMLSPIKKRDAESSMMERYMYYRTRSTYPPKSEPKVTSIRELYREVDAERSLRQDYKPTLSTYEPKVDYTSLKEDIETASRKVERILKELRFYKNKYESFIEQTKEYQKPKAFISEDQIQQCIAQCQALGRQIDLLQEKYSRILNIQKPTLYVTEHFNNRRLIHMRPNLQTTPLFVRKSISILMLLKDHLRQRMIHLIGLFLSEV